MNYKRKHSAGHSSCGLCKPGKREHQPRKDRKYYLSKIIEKETNPPIVQAGMI